MKNVFLNFLLSPWINWISPMVLVAIAVFACVVYYRPSFAHRRTRIFLLLAATAAAFRLLFAGVKTGLQYYAWLQSDISKFLLPPHQSISVLLRYSWTHFWLNALIAIGAALLFFVVLRVLYSYNERYFDTGEIELGALMALVAGWPHFVVFMPAVFLSVVIVSIIRGVVFREPYTTLGLPFFIGTAIALVATPSMIKAFHLVALSI